MQREQRKTIVSDFRVSNVAGFKLESLILAQNERWRRA